MRENTWRGAISAFVRGMAVFALLSVGTAPLFGLEEVSMQDITIRYVGESQRVRLNYYYTDESYDQYTDESYYDDPMFVTPPPVIPPPPMDVSAASLKTSNPKVFTVGDQNLLTFTGVGTATLTAYFEGLSVSKKITVQAAPFAISGAASVYTGKTATYKATLKGSAVSGSKLTWKVSNSKLASIDKNGKLTAKAAGEVKITATYKSTSTYTATKTVKISAPVKSLKITGAAKLVSGAKASAYKLTATYTNGKKGTVAGTWKVSNTKLAKVDKNGNVTPLAEGKVTLTATFGGKSAILKITIEEVHMKSVSISGVASVKVGKSAQYKLLGKLTNGQSAGQTPNASWKSSNTKIATIDKNGKLTAKAAGKVTITGTYKSKNKSHTSKKTITITK